MKNFGKIFLYVGLLVFIISTYASGNTHYVTETGGSGTMSAVEFNSLTGNHTGDTFFFSGVFSTRIIVNVHGSSSGHVTLDGLQSGSCTPTTALDLSLCTGAADLTDGMIIGTKNNPAKYVFVQDFNMDATQSSQAYVVRVETLGDTATGGRVVFRRNTIVNAPQMFFHWYGNDGPYNVIEDNKFLGMGRKGQVHASTSFMGITNSVIRRNIFGHDYNDIGFILSDWSRWGQINFHHSHRLLIEQNRIFGAYGGTLLRPKEGGLQDNLIIRHNILHNGNNHGIFPYGNSQQHIYIYGNMVSSVYEVGIWVSSSANDTHIWSNIVKDANKIGIGAYSFQWEAPVNTHVSNNTVVYSGFEDYNTRAGIRMNWTAGDMRIINNIVAHNDQSRSHPKQMWYNSYTSLQSTHNLAYGSSGKNTLWSLSSDNTDNATHTLSQTQSAGYEQSSLVADPKFVHLGTVPSQTGVWASQKEYHRDLRLTADSPAINSGRDLSGFGSFSINLGTGDSWFRSYTGYGTITFSYDDGLHPSTDWSTPIPSVVPAKFSDYGSRWERGAYVFKDKTTDLNPPSNLRIINLF